MITVAQVKEHLRITASVEDDLLTSMIARAEDMLFGYLGYADESALYEQFGEQTFYTLEQALLMMIQIMHDDATTYALTDGIKLLVTRFRTVRLA